MSEAWKDNEMKSHLELVFRKAHDEVCVVGVHKEAQEVEALVRPAVEKWEDEKHWKEEKEEKEKQEKEEEEEEEEEEEKKK